MPDTQKLEASIQRSDPSNNRNLTRRLGVQYYEAEQQGCGQVGGRDSRSTRQIRGDAMQPHATTGREDEIERRIGVYGCI